MIRKIKYKNNYNKKHTAWCLVNDSGVGSNEFTVCGTAIDSDFDFDNAKFLGEEKEGYTPTCKDCKKIISWYKSLLKGLAKNKKITENED